LIALLSTTVRFAFIHHYQRKYHTMETRKSIIIAPSIRVKDMQKSLDFYTKTLGLHESDKLTRKDGKIAHASVGYETPILTLSSVEDVFTSEVKDTIAKNKLGVGVEFHIGMNGSKKLDQYFTEVKAKGVTVVNEPKTESWGDRNFTVCDPDGYAITFSEHDNAITPEARKTALEAGHSGLNTSNPVKTHEAGNTILDSAHKGAPVHDQVHAAEKATTGSEEVTNPVLDKTHKN